MIYPFFLLGENVFTFKHNPDIVVTYIKNERKKMILKSHIKRLALLFPLGIILFSGCATNTANYVCRHKAPGYAMAWHQAHGDNVRMLVGTTAKNEYHVIAQAQEAATDFKYASYQGNIAKLICDYRNATIRYNGIVTGKNIWKDNIMFGWFIIELDSNMKEHTLK